MRLRCQEKNLKGKKESKNKEEAWLDQNGIKDKQQKQIQQKALKKNQKSQIWLVNQVNNSLQLLTLNSKKKNKELKKTSRENTIFCFICFTFQEMKTSLPMSLWSCIYSIKIAMKKQELALFGPKVMMMLKKLSLNFSKQNSSLREYLQHFKRETSMNHKRIYLYQDFTFNLRKEIDNSY